MQQDFQKPFTSPPTIFSVALFTAIGLGFLSPWAVLPWQIQIALGPALILSGVILIQRLMADIDSAGTTYDPYENSTELVTAGIYQFSRNPGYLGLAVIQTGAAILLDNVWIFIAGLIAIVVTTRFVIQLEERKLADTFGATYENYKKRVRRWI